MGDTGLEPHPKTTGKMVIFGTGGAESGAVGASDPDLQAIITAWPSVSEETRPVVIRLVEADRDEKVDNQLRLRLRNPLKPRNPEVS